MWKILALPRALQESVLKPIRVFMLAIVTWRNCSGSRHVDKLLGAFLESIWMPTNMFVFADLTWHSVQAGDMQNSPG